ncbi:MAG: SAM-dependent methyltransferase [Chloroflexi bacterium]|nr:MAG: SAM-dependent methyltransferase [Chloroflexota bacterium]
MMRFKALGDFQTPLELAKQIVQCIMAHEHHWTRALEPTCGKGNFIQALLQAPIPPQEIIGVEYQLRYVQQARQLIRTQPDQRSSIQIIHADVFSVDWQHDITWKTCGPLLIVGNPPWVTNAALGTLNAANHPQKTNPKNLQGLAAITGDANFDLAESIIWQLIQAFQKDEPTLAFICKTSVARNILQQAAKTHIPIQTARLYHIDAKRWFNAAVDACLFVMELRQGAANYQAQVFDRLDAPNHQHTIAYTNGHLIADVQSYQQWAFIDGTSSLSWRSGLKHDAATIMELTDKNGSWYNRLGERVDVEPAYVYPLVKGSDIQRLFLGKTPHKRAVIVPQKRLGEDTTHLAHTAPKLWAYLNEHAAHFKKENRPYIATNRPSPFSVSAIIPFHPIKSRCQGFIKTHDSSSYVHTKSGQFC